MIDDVRQHLTDMFELTLAIPLRVVDAVVNHPELIPGGIDVDAGDDADPFHHGMGVTAILPTHQLDGEGGVLIEYGVIKDDITVRRLDHLACNVLPHQPWGDTLTTQIPVDRIVRKLLAVVSKVCQCVVDLTDQQVLAII